MGECGFTGATGVALYLTLMPATAANVKASHNDT